LNESVGILGGSFDPVHEGHLELARRALDQVPCDAVWFLPAARAIHKPRGADATAEHRRAMLEIALEGEPRMSICPIELEAEGPMRSVESMRHLAERHPSTRWFFLIGEDSFARLGSWYRPDELFDLADPVVLPRPGASTDRPSTVYGHRVRWLEGPPIDLSSTRLREQLQRGERPEGLLPGVIEYVRRHRLYSSEHR
jgi:nicotinate-nucleotide adenylyltransferase